MIIICCTHYKCFNEIYSKSIRYRGKMAILTTVLNITERKNAEEKLIESEEKFRKIAENTFIGISILQDNLIKYVNNGMEKLTGFLTEELTKWSKNHLFERFHPEHRPFVIKQLEQIRSGEKNVVPRYNFKLITKSGKSAK